MMRRVACAAVFLLVCPIALAQMTHGMVGDFPPDQHRVSPCEKLLRFAPAVLQPDFQKVGWPAIVGDSKSQQFLYFSQAMAQYYGLNYEEAMRNFKRAKAVDPAMAMAPWGIALAAGSNINLTLDDKCHALAQVEINCAYSLAGGPQVQGCERKGSVTALEKELIAALQKRYDYDVKKKDTEAYPAAQRYSEAMKAIWDKNQNDHNIGALYAESLMDLHPWNLYENDGTPKPWTPDIVSILEKSIGDSPEDIGANHYDIHGIEGSKDPRKAKLSADLLQVQVRKSGHLVHMSSHIYLLLGQYEDSLDANKKAVDNDVDQYAEACRGPYEVYVKNDKCPQLYYGHYGSHNHFFGSVSATFLGQSEEAMKLACATAEHTQRFVIYEPPLQRYMTAPLMTMVVNRNWTRILEETKEPEPKFDNCYRQAPFDADSGCYILRAIYYWARGMAHANLGDFNAASTDFANMVTEKRRIASHPPMSWGNNDAASVLSIAEWIINARINWGRKDPYTTVGSLISAFRAEDELAYDEPPQWFTPAREALGGAYLQTKQYDQARYVFEEALRRHPASGRALYGRMRALQGLGDPKAKSAEEDFCAAWQYADYTMTDADLWPPMSNESTTDGKVTCAGKVLKPRPSECACRFNWPPSADAADRHVKDLECSK